VVNFVAVLLQFAHSSAAFKSSVRRLRATLGRYICTLVSNTKYEQILINSASCTTSASRQATVVSRTWPTSHRQCCQLL